MSSFQLKPFWIYFIGEWFFFGRLKAPGTMGTLGTIPFVWLLSFISPLWYAALTFLCVLGAIGVAQIYENLSKKKDPSQFVFDEVVGFLVTMLFVPFSWLSLILGFILFRGFDILKPFPINYVEKRCKGGVGVVVDDVIAGAFSCLILQGLYHFEILEF